MCRRIAEDKGPFMISDGVSQKAESPRPRTPPPPAPSLFTWLVAPEPWDPSSNATSQDDRQFRVLITGCQSFIHLSVLVFTTVTTFYLFVKFVLNRKYIRMV